MAVAPHFADRAEAGRRLAAALPRPPAGVVVLGLARGGIPVAAEVAAAFGAQLDALVVRKVGHPRQPEYALGAVSEDGVVLPAGLPAEAVAEQLARARAQADVLRDGRPPARVAGAPAVIVDDGLATGRSMATAVESVRRRHARTVTIAVPVAAAPAVRAFEGAGATVHAVGVVEPPDFVAVGQFYDDFAQVSDEAAAAFLTAGARSRSS
jgi:putative phosphoribosyl transferase